MFRERECNGKGEKQRGSAGLDPSREQGGKNRTGEENVNEIGFFQKRAEATMSEEGVTGNRGGRRMCDPRGIQAS